MKPVSLSKPLSLPGSVTSYQGRITTLIVSRDRSLARCPSGLCDIEFTCNSLCGVS